MGRSSMMRNVTRQLERVRRHGRMLLIGRRLAQWVAAVACLAVVCGLVDYALRLPPWPRLVIAVAVVTVALGWLVTRVAEAARFSPPLSVLALRAERMYPQLVGVLASGVEFATRRAPERESPTTAALWTSLPFPYVTPSMVMFASIRFLALSQAPPALAWNMARSTPETVTPTNNPPSMLLSMNPITTGTVTASNPGTIISRSAAAVAISTHRV